MPVGVMCGGDKSEVLHNGLEWVSGQYPWIQSNLDTEWTAAVPTSPVYIYR